MMGDTRNGICHSKSLLGALDFMKKGSPLWKVKSLNKWYRRKFLLNTEQMKIVYEPSHKSPCTEKDPTIDISDILDVRKGWKTDIFNKIAKSAKKQAVKMPSAPPIIDEKNCFSIIIASNKRTIDLVAPDEAICDMWVRGLQHQIAIIRSLEQEKNFSLWLKRQFQEADQDNNGVLNFCECLQLLKQLNIEMDKDCARIIFEKADTNNHMKNEEPALDSKEFIDFYHSLQRRSELEALFKRNTDQALMTNEELGDFLRDEQFMTDVSNEFCREIIDTYEPSESKHQGLLSLDGFYMLMKSKVVYLCNPKHNLVYQDMKHPISHYYIASSHNTYLLGNQLTGSSSVEAYIVALKNGCRCIELDCWDGDDGDPIIYHGYTLTSKISFQDVITDGIKPYAFQSSEYPLILSIENHCSLEQQEKMANYLKTILGDMLYTNKVDLSLSELPSVESLCKKILVKAKKLAVDKEERGLEIIKQSIMQSMDGKSNNLEMSDYMEDESESESSTAGDSSHHVEHSKKKKVVISPALSCLVNYIQAVHFHSFEHSKETNNWWTMSSFGESKATGFATKSPAEFVAYNRRQLSRIYPSGKRQDSSNLNPVLFWNVGCQIVALNYQTAGKPMNYNRGMFRRNGGCGYVLKPDFLRAKDSIDPLASAGADGGRTLHLRIISGANIPKPAGSSPHDIIDPYVCLYVVGDTPDELKYKTSVVRNNGFNPVWDETLTATVSAPQLTLLSLAVRDHSTTGSDSVLGVFCLHFDDLMPGYRHVPLEDQLGNSIAPASLFVHVRIEETSAPSQEIK